MLCCAAGEDGARLRGDPALQHLAAPAAGGSGRLPADGRLRGRLSAGPAGRGRRSRLEVSTSLYSTPVTLEVPVRLAPAAAQWGPSRN